MAIKKPIAPPINQVIKNVIKCSISVWPVIKYFPIPYNTLPNKPPEAIDKNLLRLLFEIAGFFIGSWYPPPNNYYGMYYTLKLNANNCMIYSKYCVRRESFTPRLSLRICFYRRNTS
jgi:hypothetical protein